MRKNKRAKACDILSRVRKEVYARDMGEYGPVCICCGRNIQQRELAHIIGRAQGGLGIAMNLVTLGGGFDCLCHKTLDSGTRAERQAIKARLVEYLKGFYPVWDEDNLIYRKWE